MGRLSTGSPASINTSRLSTRTFEPTNITYKHDSLNSLERSWTVISLPNILWQQILNLLLQTSVIPKVCVRFLDRIHELFDFLFALHLNVQIQVCVYTAHLLLGFEFDLGLFVLELLELSQHDLRYQVFSQLDSLLHFWFVNNSQNFLFVVLENALPDVVLVDARFDA